ncbi:MAG: AraC family transcriptional regulator N-terminal domain-containing protein [Chloroflexota bacterium]
MSSTLEKREQLIRLLLKHTPSDGGHFTSIPQVGTFRASSPQPRTPLLYDARLIVLAQGEKICYVGERKYQLHPGQCLVVTLLLPVEVVILGASQQRPALMTGITLDLNKIAALLFKVDGLKEFSAKGEKIDPSSVFIQTADDALMDAIIRLLQTLDKPADRLVLSDSIIEEIYFRLLSHNQLGALYTLLQQKQQIQQISNAIVEIHSHLNKSLSVNELAHSTGLSTSSFHKAFKEVMHMSPLQYAKSIKLTLAQSLLREGKSVSEVSRHVGYNSSTQFSREFKRRFGYPPSKTGSN